MSGLTKDISIKAIIIGMLADMGGTFAFSIVFGILATLLLSSTGRDVKDLLEYARTPVFMISSLIAGSLFIAFGGYITALTAKKAEMKNALLMGIATVAFGVAASLILAGPKALGLDLAAQFLAIPFALLGGYIRLKVKAENPEKKAL